MGKACRIKRQLLLGAYIENKDIGLRRKLEELCDDKINDANFFKWKSYVKFCIENSPMGELPKEAVEPLIAERDPEIKEIAIKNLTARLKGKGGRGKTSKPTKKEVQKEIRNVRAELYISKNQLPPPSSLKLLQGDFREVAGDISDDSVDLIFTDPPYSEEYLDLWADLGDLAERVLKPGAFLVTYTPHEYLPQILDALKPHLNYWWIGGIYHTGGNARIFGKKLWIQWKPLLFFYKATEPRDHEWFGDMFTGEKNKEFHEWSQGESEAAYFIEKLTKPGELVLDPMCGPATFPKAALKLGRQAIGIEIDPETYRVALATVGGGS